MKIAIASGKGGTGKTTVAVNLAMTIASTGQQITLCDCDVEEPNCHLFLKPGIIETFPVAIPQPRVIRELCNGCGVCADVCEYHALTVMGGHVLVFSELCHGCGACTLLCPEKAIVEEDHPVGSVKKGASGGIRFVQGSLDIAEVMSPVVINHAKKRCSAMGVVVVDSPPGTSCPVVEAVRDADFVLLVTEPTPFGLHDLTLAVEMVRALDRPFAVALNRCDAGDQGVRSFCENDHIEIVLSIPDDRRIAERYARGDIDLSNLPNYRTMFERCYRRIVSIVNEGRRGEKRRKRKQTL